MDVLFFPVLLNSESNSSTLEARVRLLEQSLALSFGLMAKLIERLDEKLGSNALGPELSQLIRCNDKQEIDEAVEQITAHLKQGESGPAAKLFREYAGVTWDQAHAAIKNWHLHKTEEKVRWFQLSKWIRSMQGM